jgi:hypothetical protein
MEAQKQFIESKNPESSKFLLTCENCGSSQLCNGTGLFYKCPDKYKQY